MKEELKEYSTTVFYKDVPIKVVNGVVFCRSFGTTYYNQSMHWGWSKIKPSGELKELLEKRGLI